MKCLIVEEFVAARANYCVQVAILPEGEIRLIGSNLQICAPNGIHLGNRVGTAQVLPDHVAALAMEIAVQGAARGFRGIAGFDILLDQDDRALAVDLNFRVNASTPFLFLLSEFRQARGLPCAEFVHAETDLPPDLCLSGLRMAFDAGWLLLASACDAAYLGAGATRSRVRLVVLGGDDGQLARRLNSLAGYGLLAPHLAHGAMRRLGRSLRRRILRFGRRAT